MYLSCVRAHDRVVTLRNYHSMHISGAHARTRTHATNTLTPMPAHARTLRMLARTARRPTCGPWALPSTKWFTEPSLSGPRPATTTSWSSRSLTESCLSHPRRELLPRCRSVMSARLLTREAVAGTTKNPSEVCRGREEGVRGPRAIPRGRWKHTIPWSAT